MKKKILFAATGATAAACALGHHAEASEYKVQAGDSLWLIANNHGLTIEELKALNNLTSNLIFPNQYLKVSKSSTQTVNSSSRSTSTSTSSATGTHTVKPGESLSLIAYKYNTTYQKIMALNNLDSFFIYPGQTLKVTGNVVVKPTKAKPVVSKKPVTQTNTGIHVVEPGESVSLIAQNYNISVNQLMQLNGLSSYLIFPGQELKVSGNVRTTSSNTTTNTNTSAPRATSGNTYVVQPGDYLYKVAQMYNVTIEDIKAWNNLSSNVLYVNQKLIVKGTAVQQKPAASTPVVTATPTPTSYSPVFNHSNLYDYGQCTWYVFNKRAAIGKGISTYWWHAFNWANGARNDGYTVNNIPEVGAIAQTTQGAYGHVAFVERVNADGTILVSETNYLTPAGVVGYRTLTRAQMAAYVFIH